MSTTALVVMRQDGEDQKVLLFHPSDGYPEYMLPVFRGAYAKFVTPSVPKYEEWQPFRAGRVGTASALIVAADPHGFVVEGCPQDEAAARKESYLDYIYTVLVTSMGNGMGTDEVEAIRAGRRPVWKVKVEKRTVTMSREQRAAWNAMTRETKKHGHATGVGIDMDSWKTKWVTLLPFTDVRSAGSPDEQPSGQNSIYLEM